MRRWRDVGFVVSVVILAGVACSDPDGPESPPPCVGKVTMTVTLRDTTPQFSWTPRCGVWMLEASLGPTIQLYPSEWRIDADTAVIVPPVTLGVTPPNARSSGLLALVSGLNYRVDVYNRVPVGPLEWVGNAGWRQP